MPVSDFPKLQEAVLKYVNASGIPVGVSDLAQDPATKHLGATAADLTLAIGELVRREKVRYTEGWRVGAMAIN